MKNPTGVEIYTDRVVSGLLGRADQLGYKKIKCYVKTAVQLEKILDLIDDVNTDMVEIVLIQRRNLWTFFGLSLEMYKRPVDVLFVPSHTLPLFIPDRSVLTVHGLESMIFPHAYSYFQRFLQSFSLRFAKKKHTDLIAVSESVKNDILKFFQYSAERIHVIWNGYDPVKSLLEKHELDMRLRDIVSDDFILSVGRLEERKNQKRLIHAFEIVADRFPKFKLILIGPDGYGAKSIHDSVEKSSVRSRIVVAGYRDQASVRYMLSRAHVFAYPSLAEGFGIPILEAFSVGCPVLTSLGSAQEEIGGDAVEYCDPLSVRSIADGLIRLLTNSDLLKSHVSSGKKRLNFFSWERCVDETVLLLRDLSYKS